jgi:hypothetical protein
MKLIAILATSGLFVATQAVALPGQAGALAALTQVKRQILDDLAVSLDEAINNFDNLDPGTPVVDGALDLNEGESCTTTSTQGVLGCQDGTGGTFNIVDGERRN